MSVRRAPMRALSAMIGLVLLLAVGACGESDDRPSSVKAESTGFVRDDVPGLGLSDAAARRDELIAAYEDWTREQYKADCMADQGFDYRPRMSMPVQVLQELSRDRSVLDAVSSRRPLAKSAIPRGLGDVAKTSPDADAYYEALYGEPADGVLEGIDADNDGTVATGGCHGEAWDTIGSVWDFRDSLQDDLDSARREVDDEGAGSEAFAEFVDCGARLTGLEFGGAADIEAAVGEGEIEADEAAAVFGECFDPLEEEKAGKLRERESQLLSAQPRVAKAVADYEKLLKEALENEDFVKYVAGFGG